MFCRTVSYGINFVAAEGSAQDPNPMISKDYLERLVTVAGDEIFGASQW